MAKPGAEDAARMRAAVTAWQMMLVHYCRKRLGSLEQARDIVQEAFLRFWQQPPTAIAEAAEKAWLFQVCRNLMIDLYRKKGADHSLDDVQEPLSDQPAPDAGDATREFDHHLTKLTGAQQEVVRLKFQHDLSYKEISAVTGHSVSNVGVFGLIG